MGTKIQYAINPLATASDNSFAVNQLGDWGYSQEVGPRKHLERSARHHFKHSMDEMLDLRNIETIKKTLLMHEDIFKRQVRELHRLYDRQMKLMIELKNEAALTKKNVSISEFAIWHQQMPDIKSNLAGLGLRDDPGERTASCSGESPRRPKIFNLEMLAEEGPSTSIRGIEQDQKSNISNSRLLRNNAISINANGSDEEIDVELTLSIGCSSSKKRLNSQVNLYSLELGNSDSNYNEGELCSSSLIKRGIREDLGDPGPAVSSSINAAALNQNVARPNWMFQDLSLNRT